MRAFRITVVHRGAADSKVQSGELGNGKEAGLAERGTQRESLRRGQEPAAGGHGQDFAIWPKGSRSLK